MAILDFIADYEPSDMKDFWKMKDHEIPTSPGVYMLVARGNSHFHYPIGKSPIYYIGQSKNLRSRLLTHLRHATEARDNRKEALYWPRYEFAAVYAGRYCFIRTWQGLTPKGLEEEVLASFAKKYRCFPIANGSGSWNRVENIIGMT